MTKKLKTFIPEKQVYIGQTRNMIRSSETTINNPKIIAKLRLKANSVYTQSLPDASFDDIYLKVLKDYINNNL